MYTGDLSFLNSPKDLGTEHMENQMEKEREHVMETEVVKGLTK